MLATAMPDSSPQAAVGIDLGGSSIKAALVSDRLEIVSRNAVPTDLRSQGVLLSAIERLVESVSKDTTPSAVGFGLPSQIDQRHGRVLDSTNVPLEDLDFKAEMASRLGVPVEIDNDANVACLAEWRIGAARGAGNVVMLTLGTGVGGGLVLEGRLYRGSIGSGAELGHMSVDENGPHCQGHCNSRGCLEVLASATGIMRLAGDVADERPAGSFARARERGEDLDARFVIEQAKGGDSDAVEALRRAGRYLGIGLASFANIFNPEVILIGGGASAAGELLIGPARTEMVRRGLPPTTRGVRVAIAELGNTAGVLGAAELALDLASDRQAA